MEEPSDRARVRPLDQFHGARQLRDLSMRLVDWYEAPVTDEEVAEAIGQEALPAFRYSQQRLAGKVRKVTLEPSFCHSADVAFRAVELGFSTPTLIVALLHDVVEETSATIADVPAAIRELRERFGGDSVRSVTLLTNRYQLIFKGLEGKVRPDAPFETRTRRAYRAALDVLSYELPLDITSHFVFEFQRMSEFLDTRADLAKAARIARRDKRFTVATYLERQLYAVYVDEMVDRAHEELRHANNGQAITAIIVKLLDLTDNIRTNEISNRLSLFKLMNKAETMLDRTREGLLDKLPGTAVEDTTIPALHRLVQLRLVDQLEARHRAVSDNFAETRFAGLIDFLAQQTERLREKYEVPDDCVEDILKLEGVVTDINASDRRREAEKRLTDAQR